MKALGLSYGSITLLLVISALAAFAVYRLFQRLRAPSITPDRLEVDIQELGGCSYRQLILMSVVSLFVEMLMIRWVSSEIRIFAYFKNFVRWRASSYSDWDVTSPGGGCSWSL